MSRRALDLRARIAEYVRDEATMRRVGTEAALATADECRARRQRCELVLALLEVS